MSTLWNRGLVFILAGVVLQSFCSLGLVFFNPMLNSVTGGIFDLSNAETFVFVWVAFTFFSKIIGAYTLGKHADSKGFLNAQKIIVTGYVVTTCLLYLCCLYIINFYTIKPVIVLIACFNVFLFPATFMFPIIYLMKNHDVSNHVRVGSLVILSALLGHELSYITLNYIVGYNLQIMSGIFFCCSLLCGLVYYLGKAAILSLEKHVTQTQKNQLQPLPSYLAKFLAMLIGGVCGAVVTHHYFFIAPYILNVLILKDSGHEQAHIFFYVTIGIFSVFVFKISDYIDRSKLMILSLLGMLILTLSINIYELSSIYVYVLYQTLLALFFVGFLSPCLALIFSLFKNTQPFFNSTVWFYLGVSFSFLSGYVLSEKFGPFNRYFLVVSPLVLNAGLCLIAMLFIGLSANRLSLKKQVLYA